MKQVSAYHAHLILWAGIWTHLLSTSEQADIRLLTFANKEEMLNMSTSELERYVRGLRALYYRKLRKLY